MKLPKRVALLLAITLVTSNVNIVSANTMMKSTNSESLVGAGRIETAIEISKKGWEKSEEVVIVNESSIPDSVCAIPFAYAKNAPVLLSGKSKISTQTKNELKRLGVKKVYLIGGENVLSKDIENELNSEGINIDRIFGNDRYKTSIAIAKRLNQINPISEIAIANGNNGLVDAVSICAVAANKNMPVILSNNTNEINGIKEFIKDKKITNSYIIGGESVLSKDIENSLPNPMRLHGEDRSETNAKVIEAFYSDTDLKNVYVAKDGSKKVDDLIDSLAVGALAAKNNSPIIVVGNKLSEKQKDIINTKSFSTITKVGGNGNENAFKELENIQKSNTYEVKTIDELNEVMKKVDANDVVNFKPSTTIDKDISLVNSNAITINLYGKYTKTVTINMPNGDVTNNGTIENIVIDDIKDGTFINKGTVNKVVVNDKNGASILNDKNGKIKTLNVEDKASGVNLSNNGKMDSVNVNSGASDIVLSNKGTMSNLKNDSEGTKLVNNGTINKMEGSKKPVIEGNKPGGTSGGGSSSGGGSNGGGTSGGGSSSGGGSNGGGTSGGGSSSGGSSNGGGTSGGENITTSAVVTTQDDLVKAITNGKLNITLNGDITLDKPVTLNDNQALIIKENKILNVNSELTIKGNLQVKGTLKVSDEESKITLLDSGALHIKSNSYLELGKIDNIETNGLSVIIYNGSNVKVGQKQYIGNQDNDAIIELYNYENINTPAASFYINNYKELLLTIYDKAKVIKEDSGILDINVNIRSGELVIPSFDVIKQDNNSKYVYIMVGNNGTLIEDKEIIVSKDNSIFSVNNDISRIVFSKRNKYNLDIDVLGDISMNRPFGNATIYPANIEQSNLNEPLYPCIDIKFNTNKGNVNLNGIDNPEQGKYTIGNNYEGKWTIQMNHIVGKDITETSALIAGKQTGYTSVILVNENSPYEAITASGLSGVLNAPILMTEKDTIPESVKSIIQQETVKNVYIIGGEVTISKDILSEITSLGKTVERIVGDDRFKTSYLVAQKMEHIMNKTMDKVILIDGTQDSYIDAMNICQVASKNGIPIILTNGNNIPNELLSKYTNIYGIGRYNNISSNVDNNNDYNYNINILCGEDRYETNKIIINEFYESSNEFYIVDTNSTLNMLIGAPLAKNIPIVQVGLLEKNSKKEILKHATKLTVLGEMSEKLKQECINATR